MHVDYIFVNAPTTQDISREFKTTVEKKIGLTDKNHVTAYVNSDVTF